MTLTASKGRLTALAVALALTVSTGFAATYYVSSTAAPGGDGSMGAPYQTIAAAMAVVGANDTVILQNGPFVENVVIPAVAGLTIEGDGASQVMIEGASATAHVVFVTEGATGLTLRNLYVKASPAASAAHALVYFNATAAVHNVCENLLIENCTFDGLRNNLTRGVVGANAGSYDGASPATIYGFPGPNAGFGPFKGQLTIRNCTLKNIWDSRIVDTNDGGLGDSRVANPLTNVYFENNYLTGNKGAVAFRCASGANTTLYIRNNKADHYDNGAQAGGGGIFKLFWPGTAYVEGNELRNVAVLQGSQFDESNALGGAVLLRDRRFYENAGLTGLADPAIRPWNVQGYDPSFMFIRGNIFADVVQALYVDAVPYGNTSTSHTWNAAFPGGKISDNIFENAVFDIQTKQSTEIVTQTEQMEIVNNTFGGDPGPQFSFRDGLIVHGGEQLNVGPNYYGDGGLADLQVNAPAGTNPVNANGALASPNLVDEDLDGLWDWEEDVNDNGVKDPTETDKNNPDTDGDGYWDGWEVRNGFDPLDPNDPYDPNAPDPNYEDADGDGLPLIEEIARATNPNKWDTDGDGFSDGYEVIWGTDPKSAASKPTLGDVNDNGRVDNVDAVIIFQAALGALNFNSFSSKIMRMDLNGNGVLDYTDAIDAFDFFLGNINQIPRP